MQKKAGIDLGSANLFAAAGGSILLSEPSAIALDRETGQVLYFGARAEKLLAAPPKNVGLLRPFRNGLASELEYVQKILGGIIADSFAGISHLALAVPCSAGEIEEGALIEIAAHCDAAYPHTVYSPIAAIAGSGCAARDNILSVELGASMTNIALVCDGEIIYMKSIPVAGEAFDRAIAAYLLRERGAKVSLRTAETVKITIGSVWSEGVAREMQIAARHPETGAPVSITVQSEEMYLALEEPTAMILEAICVAISHIPTKHVHRVFENGILLSGGTALLDGLDRMISGVTGVKTVKARNPLTAVCLGLDAILASLGDRAIVSVRNLSGLYLGKCRSHSSGR